MNDTPSRITDFLGYHNIPYPSHICGWEEREHVRIVRFKGSINRSSLPKILDFKARMDKAGLPVKNAIFDGKKVTEIDSATVAVLLLELKKKNQKIAMINPPVALKSYMEIFHERDKLPVYETEEEAIAALNKKEDTSEYFPILTNSLKKNKCLSLLIALVLFIIALPFFESNMMGILYLGFFNFVLLSGIYAVSYNMRHVAGGILLAAPILITAWSNVFIKDPKIINAEMAFLTIFLMYTIAVTLKHILAAKKVTLNELFGALAVYIMIGMTFGVIYALLQSLAPGSLGFPPEEKVPTMTSFFYFSFLSMSSTGFSGITAIAPLARAIAIVQVIIGVMYMSVLIGKLVSANTPDDDGLFDNMETKLKFDFWSDELTENFFRQRTILLVLAMAMLNYASSVLMTVLNWPFFMDSWGTSLAVVLGGLRAGIFSGIIYNVVMAWTFWEPSGWVWMFCNILISILTWFFLKWGWIDLHKPGKLLGAGVISGLLNSAAVAIISYAANIPIYQGTMAVYHFFMNMTGNSFLASAAEKVAVEVADKTMSLLLVAVALVFIQDFLKGKKKALAELTVKDVQVTQEISEHNKEKKMKNAVPTTLVLAFMMFFSTQTAHAGLLDKINAATKKLEAKTQQMQTGKTSQQAEDPDRPLHLDEKGGSCEGHRSATCMDYGEAVDKCMDPLNGYRMKLLGNVIEKKLQTEELTDKQRKNLEEDLAGIREAEKNKSDDPTIAGKAKSQRYLEDISEEDQVCVNADYGTFHKKIYNKCMGADHMGIGKRTEMMEGQETMTCEQAIAEYRSTHKSRRASTDCLAEVTGLRYQLMADMMEKKMQTLKLSDKERAEWEADIAAVRKTAAEGGKTMPQANDPTNPMRPMMRLNAPEEQMALSSEFSKQSQTKIAECTQGGTASARSENRSKGTGLVDHSKSPANHDAQAVNMDSKKVDHSKCGALGAGCLDGMQDMTACQKEIGGYRWMVMAEKMQAKFNTLKPNLSGDEIKAWREDIGAVKEAETNMSAKVNSPDPANEYRYQDRLSRAEQQEMNQEYLKLYNGRMKYCNDHFSKMTDHN